MITWRARAHKPREAASSAAYLTNQAESGTRRSPEEDLGLFISITMPSTTTGANYFGQQLLDEAKSLGFTPNDYTIMPFDGGFSGGVLTGHCASGLQRTVDEHVRLVQRTGLRARGVLRDERPHRHGRVLLSERFPDGAQLRGELRDEQVHVLVG